MKNFKMCVNMLIVSAVIANLLDFVTTLAGLSLGKIENNPIMAYAVSVSPWFFSFVKLGAFMLIALPLAMILVRQKGWLKWCGIIPLIFAVLYFTYLGVHNLWVILF